LSPKLCIVSGLKTTVPTFFITSAGQQSQTKTDLIVS
jgi:hypothetical protein